MSRAIPNETISEIRSLLARGFSQREIAKETGVSRSFVHLVEQGKRKEQDDSVETLREPLRPYPAVCYERCTDCGALVQLPCLACQIRG